MYRIRLHGRGGQGMKTASRVLGTAFSLTREGSLTRVAVERGAVRVDWVGGEAFLSAGQSGLYPPPAPEAGLPSTAAEPLAELANGVAFWHAGSYARS